MSTAPTVLSAQSPDRFTQRSILAFVSLFAVHAATRRAVIFARNHRLFM
jgi:hypothetical protein